MIETIIFILFIIYIFCIADILISDCTQLDGFWDIMIEEWFIIGAPLKCLLKLLLKLI